MSAADLPHHPARSPALGVEAERVHVDRATGTNQAPPGLREPLAACRTGDVLVFSKL